MVEQITPTSNDAGDQFPITTSSPFLCIPRELRDKIYRSILKATQSNLRKSHNAILMTFLEIARVDTDILTVNKQISAEAQEILYNENTFSVEVESNYFDRVGYQAIEIQHHQRFKNLDIKVMVNWVTEETLQRLVEIITSYQGLKRLTMEFVYTQDPGDMEIVLLKELQAVRVEVNASLIAVKQYLEPPFDGKRREVEALLQDLEKKMLSKPV